MIQPFSINAENFYQLAYSVAQQGGIFAAIEFKTKYPNAEAYSKRDIGVLTPYSLTYLATIQIEEMTEPNFLI